MKSLLILVLVIWLIVAIKAKKEHDGDVKHKQLKHGQSKYGERKSLSSSQMSLPTVPSSKSSSLSDLSALPASSTSSNLRNNTKHNFNKFDMNSYKGDMPKEQSMKKTEKRKMKTMQPEIAATTKTKKSPRKIGRKDVNNNDNNDRKNRRNHNKLKDTSHLKKQHTQREHARDGFERVKPL